MTVHEPPDAIHADRRRTGRGPATARAAAPRRVPAEAVADFVAAELLDGSREWPVVAVTTRHGAPLLDPDLLATAVGDAAQVAVIETGDATRALASQLPEKLCVYGGAGRIWWPGLTRESDPYDHPLVWVEPRAPREAERRIVSTLARRIELPGAIAIGDEVEARVLALDAHGADLEVGLMPGRCPITRVTRGWVRDPADVLRVGQVVRARVTDITPDGVARLDLGAAQDDAWSTLAEQVRPGVTVRGRVATASLSGATVELLPGACGRISADDLAGAGGLSPGVVTLVTVADIDPLARRAALVPGAPAGTEPVTLRLLPDGPGFLGEAAHVPAGGVEVAGRLAHQLAERLARAEREVLELRAQGERLAERLRHERERNRSLTRELGAARRRLAQVGELEAGAASLPPEARWRRLVQASYDRFYAGADRERYPMAEVRALPGFLASVAGLDGIEERRIADVCAHVAAGRAHEIGGLRVHPRRENGAASGQRTRDDGARAWRAALQVGAPAARRLHYWALTRDGRRVVELEAVGTHDERLG